MQLEEYRVYLQGQDLSDEAIEKRIAITGDVFAFLADSDATGIDAAAAKEVVEGLARRLIACGRNTLETFSLLRDYAGWLGHRALYVALVELLDCYNAMEVLADEIEAKHGQGLRRAIFREALPPLGADESERCAHARMIMARMARQIAPEEARDAWFRVQHGIPADVWRQSDLVDRELYRQCGTIDEFLTLKRRERDALLTRLRDEGRLWYTVEISDRVLDFIKADPEMEVGRREGDRIYITKVPYNAVRYIDETDARMKRYYACHCPLVREALLHDQPVSPDVCACSLGHASHYLAGLGLEIKGEVLESAVKGDTRCRFAFYLPQDDSAGD